MSLFGKGDKLPDVRSVTAYLFLDYRHRSCQKMIARIYEYTLENGYDVRWVGYSENEEHYAFECNGRKIMFDPKAYDEIDKKFDQGIPNDFMILFTVEFDDPDEKPLTIMYGGGTESAMKSALKDADDAVRSEEKDYKKRFKKIRRNNALDMIPQDGFIVADILSSLIMFS